MMKLNAYAQTWPIAGRFSIARGSKTEAHVLVVELEQDGYMGRGEAVPYARYNETMDAAISDIEAQKAHIETTQPAHLSTSAAKNAFDCALWDLQAKLSGVPVWQKLGLSPLTPLTTAFTLSLDEPELMGAQAAKNAHRPLLKLKLKGHDDLARIRAVHEQAPHAQLIVDGNEGLDIATLNELAPHLESLGVVLIEQPLPAASDRALSAYNGRIPLCADESLHSRAELDHCARLYDYINIKLDKTGGLTEALALKQAALDRGLGLMVGCMVASSLSMAPAFLVAQGAQFVDLDGPLLLATDCDHGMRFEGSLIHPPSPELWG